MNSPLLLLIDESSLCLSPQLTQNLSSSSFYPDH